MIVVHVFSFFVTVMHNDIRVCVDAIPPHPVEYINYRPRWDGGPKAVYRACLLCRHPYAEIHHIVSQTFEVWS